MVSFEQMGPGIRHLLMTQRRTHDVVDVYVHIMFINNHV